MPNPNPEDKRQAAREVIDILHEISTLLVRILQNNTHRIASRAAKASRNPAIPTIQQSN